MMAVKIVPASLKELLAGIAGFQGKVMIEGLSADSRTVKPGDLFIAYEGVHMDGRLFIGDAKNAGAVAVVAERDQSLDQSDYSIPVIPVSDLKKWIGVIASRFYRHPSKKMTMIGVTGTNGKSSVTYLVSNAWAASGKQGASMGTLGYGVNTGLRAGSHTTPDAINLQKNLAGWCDKVDCTIMEVSSHALAQSRVNGVDFDIAVFTNLSRDHLDYHRDFESYGAAKSKLFECDGLKHAVINLDDEFGRNLIDRIDGSVNVIAHTLAQSVYDQNKDRLNIMYGRAQPAQGATTAIDIASPWGNDHLTTKLVGTFNVENLLASLACLCLQQFSLHEGVKLLRGIGGVPGRMERYKKPGHATLVVDYAHTPDALAKAQQSLKQICQGKLITIFGCGGDRDSGKRPKMGAVAESISDRIVLTNDNSRTEDPGEIIEDILSGIKNRNQVKVVIDRSEAIVTSFHAAEERDIILIAGKGDEDYQEIQNQYHPFCDRELARRLTES